LDDVIETYSGIAKEYCIQVNSLPFSTLTNIVYEPVCEAAAATSSLELVTELVAMLFLAPDTTM